MRRLVISLAAAAVLAAIASAGAAASAASPCTSAQVSASMTVVRGSAGAGNIVYRLRLRNVSAVACVVAGRPALRLRDSYGHGLPTHVAATPPGSIGALITLAPGASAGATLRFSPDVPGKGEQTTGACEPVAHSVRVTLASPGHGSLSGPIKPATSVCEHGGMSESNLSHL